MKPSIRFDRRWEDRGDGGLGDMCDTGVKLLADNEADGIVFQVLDQREARWVVEYMALRHPRSIYGLDVAIREKAV